MMYSASIENANGQVLVLTGNESVYQVLSITGLNPPSAQINTTTAVGIDGASFNSAKLNMRNIVITLKINGDVEANRLQLYEYFRTKERCRFFFRNDRRDVFIDGRVESFACDMFANGVRAQISIICPRPAFQAVESVITDISRVDAGFVFPFTINADDPVPFSSLDLSGTAVVRNDSDQETGAVFSMVFSGSVNRVEILNTLTAQRFTLVYPFADGDTVTIDARKGQKSVTLNRGGAMSNIFAATQRGSVFFQLAPGDNPFVVSADGGISDALVNVLVEYRAAYRGV